MCLICDYGYDEESVMDVLNYVVSIFVCGDVKGVEV